MPAIFYNMNTPLPGDPAGPYFPASQPNPSLTNLGDVADQPWQGGPTGAPVPGVRTRDFPTTWATSPNVQAATGPRNPGHVHNIVSTNGQWSRGEIPNLGYGYTFALRMPRGMREPRTNIGSYNFAQG